MARTECSPKSSRATRREPPSAGALFLTASQGAVLVAGATVHIGGARLLSPEWYGRLVVVWLVLSWTKVVASSAVLPGLEKAVSEDERRLHAALSLASRWYLMAVVLLTAALLGVAMASEWLFQDPRMKGLLALVALHVPLVASIKMGQRLLGGACRFRAASLITGTYAGLGAVGVLVALVAGFGAYGAVTALLVAAAVGAVLAFYLILRERAALPRVKCPDLARRTAYWTSISLPQMLVVGTLSTIGVWLVKGLVADPNAAGFYGVAYSVSHLPSFVVFGINAAIYPSISGALARGRDDTARDISQQAFRCLVIVFAPICAFTVGNAGEILVFLFGTPYAAGAGSLTLLAPAVLLSALSRTGLRMVLATDRPGLRLGVDTFLLILGIGLHLLLIPRWGIEGAAAAYLLTGGVAAMLGLSLALYYLGTSLPLATLFRCGTGGAVVFTAGVFWPTNGMAIFAKIAIVSAAYLLTLVVLGEVGKDDFALIKNRLWTALLATDK